MAQLFVCPLELVLPTTTRLLPSSSLSLRVRYMYDQGERKSLAVTLEAEVVMMVIAVVDGWRRQKAKLRSTY
ncbi:unnamed protein product [Prunus armeniaca]|uniref:Uncharacterized protein n=1 Tax=Prunus armeniaca TaxID=36596 RepID=A0A6J5VZD2_PRUAR|nr:unnamed protein product [Prunus armeniaca]